MGSPDGIAAMNIDQLGFPGDAEVAADEAARFRESTPAERMRAIRLH